MRIGLRNFFTLFLFAALLSVSIFAPYLLASSPFDNYYGLHVNKAAPYFKGTTANKKSIDSSTFRGENVFLFFGFSNCKSSCPVQLSLLNQLSKRAQVKVVVISFMNKPDEPENLETFTTGFNENFISLTLPTQEAIDSLTRKYYVSINKNDILSDRPTIRHSNHIYLIDKEQRLRFVYVEAYPKIERILQDLRLL